MPAHASVTAEIVTAQKTFSPITLDSGERLITILGTNDIHGGIDSDLSEIKLPSGAKEKVKTGGSLEWAAIANSIREGLGRQFGNRASVALVDAGDQFQGTLLSNSNEGEALFEAFKSIGYTAVVPGNHDYDFGPTGWLVDKADPMAPVEKKREVIRLRAQQARGYFPLLSSNTFYKDSLKLIPAVVAPESQDTENLKDTKGPHPVERKITIKAEGCIPVEEITAASNGNPAVFKELEPSLLNFEQARRPDFLQPYLIRRLSGVRVAFIGVDNMTTPTTTTPENVSDLCFRDPLDAYTELANRLKKENRADVFVMIIHDGDSKPGIGLSPSIKKILEREDAPPLDAVICGHIHASVESTVGHVPVIQSGFGGTKFGRVDLIFNVQTQKLNREKTRYFSAIPMYFDRCSDRTQGLFCKKVTDANEQPQIQFEGVTVSKDTLPIQRLERIIKKYQANPEYATRAHSHIGDASEPVRRDRIAESALANLLTDSLRTASNASISFMNTGGIRADIDPGAIEYEKFFMILPFNNRAVKTENLPYANLMGLIKRSIQTCGAYGALMQSGLQVKYSRDCKSETALKEGVDKEAKLLELKTLAGESLFDPAWGEAVPAEMASRLFSVVTLDFLASGGAGYVEFGSTPGIAYADIDIARELIANHLIQSPVTLNNRTDGRWFEVLQALFAPLAD